MSGRRLQNVLSHVAEVHRHFNGNVTIQSLLMVEISASEISKRLEHVIRKTVQVYFVPNLIRKLSEFSCWFCDRPYDTGTTL